MDFPASHVSVAEGPLSDPRQWPPVHIDPVHPLVALVEEEHTLQALEAMLQQVLCHLQVAHSSDLWVEVGNLLWKIRPKLRKIWWILHDRTDFNTLSINIGIVVAWFMMVNHENPACIMEILASCTTNHLPMPMVFWTAHLPCACPSSNHHGRTRQDLLGITKYRGIQWNTI